LVWLPSPCCLWLPVPPLAGAAPPGGPDSSPPAPGGIRHGDRSVVSRVHLVGTAGSSRFAGHTRRPRVPHVRRVLPGPDADRHKKGPVLQPLAPTAALLQDNRSTTVAPGPSDRSIRAGRATTSVLARRGHRLAATPPTTTILRVALRQLVVPVPGGMQMSCCGTCGPAQLRRPGHLASGASRAGHQQPVSDLRCGSVIREGQQVCRWMRAAGRSPQVATPRADSRVRATGRIGPGRTDIRRPDTSVGDPRAANPGG